MLVVVAVFVTVTVTVAEGVTESVEVVAPTHEQA